MILFPQENLTIFRSFKFPLFLEFLRLQLPQVAMFIFLQFVEFSSIMAKNIPESHKEAQFALSALMEVPLQYNACKVLGLLK